MNKELFGVFGDVTEFRRFRSPTEFDCIVDGGSVTVGVQDVGLEIPNRTTTYSDETGSCVLWGEVYVPDSTATGQAKWLLRRYRERGTDALSALNGSYLAVIDDGDEPIVATDPVRSWECYYSDGAETRVFGTDPLAVADTIECPELSTTPLLEFLHLGVIFGNRTTIEQLHRTPFDATLSADATRSLERFVYDPQEFDYADELAKRLERALLRRSTNPGRKGMLLSGGYDSRAIVSCLNHIDECYTIDTPNGAESGVAKQIANQYGVDHQTLAVDGRYLTTDPETTKYCHGISESLHIHHGGYNEQMDVDTMYHGLLFDTFLRGHFLPRDGIELFGYTFPLNRLVSNPDVAETLMGKFGFLPESQQFLEEHNELTNDSVEFVRERLETEYEKLDDRFDSTYNGIELFGIQNQPSMPFRTHLADNYLESFVAVDSELLEWHLMTPPEHRNTKTYLKAMKKIDDDILRHRPPDRPHDSERLNEIEGFLRRSVPVVDSFGTPWPDRNTLYEQNGLDQRLFAGYPEIRCLPARLKLRLNDITNWLDDATDTVELTPSDILSTTHTFEQVARDRPVNSL